MTLSLAIRSDPVDCCAYCDRPFDATRGGARTKDHIIPKSIIGEGVRGPRNNTITTCFACNGLKGNMLPEALRATARVHRQRAETLERIADRAEAFIIERRLLP